MNLTEKNRTYHVAQSSMEMLPAYYGWIYGHFIHKIHGVAVELGCGAGLGIGNYLDRTSKIYAVDHNKELLERIAKKYPSNLVTPIQADLIQEWNFLPSGCADTVIMMDVVEHFKDDVNLMNKASALLSENGRMLVKVPAQRNLFSAIDEASGHYRRYDKEDIARLAEASQLKIESLNYCNVAGSLAYRRKKVKTNFSRSFSTNQLRSINTFIPIIKLLDFLPLRGLSLMCVMTRKT